MKKMLIPTAVLLILFIGAGYFTGDYFVTFALKRENNQPPQATANIADPTLKPPARPNFQSEIWQIQSFDNLKEFATYFLPTASSHKWAILVHGYGRDQTYAFDYAEEYLKHGYNVLTPDLRASGTSEGIYLTMGAFESQDIVKWAEKIVERDPQAKIILHGVSMGAATVLMADELQPPNVVAVVEDCGYTTAYEMFAAQMKKIFGLPEFPIMNFVDVVSMTPRQLSALKIQKSLRFLFTATQINLYPLKCWINFTTPQARPLKKNSLLKAQDTPTQKKQTRQNIFNESLISLTDIQNNFFAKVQLSI